MLSLDRFATLVPSLAAHQTHWEVTHSGEGERLENNFPNSGIEQDSKCCQFNLAKGEIKSNETASKIH